jgi:hypothetical protein
MPKKPDHKITGQWRASKGNDVIEETISDILPGSETMRLQHLLGDGKGSVTTGFSISHSEDYGNLKADAFVSVTLTCNQSMDVVEKAKDEASAMALLYVKENFNEALKAAHELIDRR